MDKTPPRPWVIGDPSVLDADSDNEVAGLIIGAPEYVSFGSAALDAYDERPPWKPEQ